MPLKLIVCITKYTTCSWQLFPIRSSEQNSDLSGNRDLMAKASSIKGLIGSYLSRLPVKHVVYFNLSDKHAFYARRSRGSCDRFMRCRLREHAI